MSPWASVGSSPRLQVGAADPCIDLPQAPQLHTRPLLPPGTYFADRLNQLDLRVSKLIRVSGARLRANVDVYNSLNGDAVLALNTAYGAAWLRPTQILQGRLVKFGAQFEF